MNLKQEDIELVGTAGLLHDIGLLKLNNSPELPPNFTFHAEMEGGLIQNMPYSDIIC